MTRNECAGCGEPREWSGVAFLAASGGFYGLVSCPECCRVTAFAVRESDALRFA